MGKKRVLVITDHPLLRESLRSLPMPNVEVVVTDHMPADEPVDAQVWILDCAQVTRGRPVPDLFRAYGGLKKIVLIAVDFPEAIVISRHSLQGVDAAAFLEKIALGTEEE